MPQSVDLIHASRVHPIVYTLIINKFATLYELKHKYDVWEALDLYEACSVHLYNKSKLMEVNR